jgi:hypothetical protein
MKTQYIILLLIVLYFVLKPSGYALDPSTTMFTQAQLQKLLNIPGSDLRHRCAAQSYGQALNMKSTAITRMTHSQFMTNYVNPLMGAEQNGTYGKLDSVYLTCLRNNHVSLS